MSESSKTHLTRPRGWLLTLAVAGFVFLAATLVPVQMTVAQGAPAVDIQASTDGISVDFFATTPRNVLTFSVRVVGPDRFVFEQRVEDTTLQWIPPGDLADGFYHWEAWVVSADVGAQMRNLTPALQARAADHWFDEEFKQTHIVTGSFKVENGLVESISNSGNEADGIPRIRRVASAILDFLVPSAHAAEPDDGDASPDAFTTNDFISIFGTNTSFNMGISGAETLHTFWSFRNDSSLNHRFDLREGGPDGTVRVTFRQGGRVGINNTNPNSRLQVNSAAAENPFRAQVAGLTGLFVHSNRGASVGSATNPPALGLRVEGDTFITGTGSSLGIQTVSPERRIHVRGPNAFLGPGIMLQGTGANANFFEMTHNTGSAGGLSFLNWHSHQGNNRLVLTSGGGVGIGLTPEVGQSLRVNPGDGLVVLNNNNVGMGTGAPAAPLHVQRADNTAQIRVEDTGAVVGVPPVMFTLQQNGFPRFNMRDNSQTNVNWDFRLSGNAGTTERFTITKVGTGGAEMELFHNGNMTIAGTLTQSSSRAAKERITELTPEAVLARLEQLGVHEWSYQRSPNERHLGPMAEDFHAVFGLGGSDKHIAPGDLAGVALAAAKALHEQVEIRDRRITALESKSAVLGVENAELRDQLERDNAELRNRLEQLEAMLLSSM